MQRLISRKSDIQKIIDEIIPVYQSNNYELFWDKLENEILNNKIKFPILEYFTKELFQIIPANKQLPLADKIIDKDYIGSYVIAGIFLQLRLKNNLEECFEKVAEYLIKGDKWYSCDIIAERVFGIALLNNFDESFCFIKEYANHKNDWVKRAAGVAIHFATKKGLKKENVEKLLKLISEQITSKSLHVKKGFGWALKTIAKYHPDLVLELSNQINNNPNVSAWFKRKISLGLSYSKKK